MARTIPILCFGAFLALSSGLQAQSPEAIGRIEGTSFQARGQVSVAQENGKGVTTLLSGSEVIVAAGHARVTLVDGSEIDICGPAQLSFLKSGGAITVALSHGHVHARVSAELSLQIYTATILAVPVSVGGNPRDTVVGLDPSGEMCVYAVHGAVRLEHQFSGQRVLVPQQGEVVVPGGQLENLRDAAGGCRCEIPATQALAQKEPPPAAKAREPSVNASATPKSEDKMQTQETAFTAVMPPLTFNADSSAPPPSPSPQKIRLIREVRLRPVTYTGRVEKPAEQQASQSSASTPGVVQPDASKPGFGTRLKNFFRRLFGGKPKS